MSMIAAMLAALLTTASLQHFPDDARIRGFFTDVLLDGARWADYGESAAFLVEDTAGEVQCLAWPPTNEYQRMNFIGDVPRRTVAIVHTHPNRAPYPSLKDIAEARRLNVPIFVLTRSTITAVNPSNGQDVTVLRGQNWASKIPQKCENARAWLAR